MFVRIKKIIATAFLFIFSFSLCACSYHSYTQTDQVPKDVASAILQSDKELLEMILAKDASSILSVMEPDPNVTEELLASILEAEFSAISTQPESVDLILIQSSSIGNSEVQLQTAGGDFSFSPKYEQNAVSVWSIDAEENRYLFLVYGLEDQDWQFYGLWFQHTITG